MTHDGYRNNLAKEYVCACFDSRVIRKKSVSLYAGDAMLVPFEGHGHGGRKVTETDLSLNFAT